MKHDDSVVADASAGGDQEAPATPTPDRDAAYRALFADHPSPMWIFDRGTLRFLDVNEAAVRGYGWSRAELLRMTIADIRPPEDVPRLHAAVAAIPPGTPGKSGVWTHRRRDGSRLDVRVSSWPAPFAGRDAQLVVADDVTEQLAAETALRTSEARWRAIVNDAPFPLMVLAGDGEILEVNDAIVQLTGYRRQDLPTTDAWIALALPEDRVRLAERLRAIVAGAGDGRPNEYWMRTRAGVRRWLIASKAIGRDERGRLVIVAMASDVTERHRAQEAIAASERFVRSTLDSLPQHVAILDTDGTILAVNEAWRRFARENGADPSEVSEGVDYLAMCDAAARGGDASALRFSEGVRSVLAGTVERFRLEYDCHSPSEQRWFECTVTRFVGTGPVRVVVAHENVTMRRRAVELMAESEARFRAMFEQAAVGLALVARDGRPLQINDRLCEIVGYAREAIIGHPFGDFAHPDDRGPDESRMARMFAGELRSYSVEKRYVRRDGRTTWVNVTATLVRTPDGQPDYVMRVVEDIDARRRAEQALQDSEERLRLALHAARQGTFDLDIATGQARMSEAYAELLGGEAPEVETVEAWLARLHPDDRDDARRAFLDCCTDRTPAYDSEFRLRRRDGAWRWVHAAGRVVERSPDGRPRRMLGTIADVTARKTMEDMLRKLSLAVEQSSDAMVITDIDGRIEYVNEAFLQATGYARDEVLGRNPRFLQSGRTPRETYRVMWDTLNAGLAWHGEFVNRRKDGSEFLEAVVVTPVRQPDGRITHYLGVKEDITQRVRDAEELERYRTHLETLVAERTAALADARRRAEAANEAKSRFLANMSHEIRTPMNGVLGAVEILGHTGLDARQADLVRTIRTSGTALLALIDDVLDFSKIEADRLQLDIRPVAVVEVVEGAGDLLLASAATQGVDLDVFVDPALPAFVETDEVRLRQLLLNLAGNAVKFSTGTGRRGRVEVDVRAVRDGPLRLALTVRDNGIGMTDATQARIFDAFFQAEAATVRRFGGTGLGLPICKRIVELMGGTIAVSSVAGAGSTFTVELPVEPIDASPVVRLPNLHGVTVAIADDVPHPPRAVRAYLEHAGARIVERGAAVSLVGTAPLRDEARGVVVLARAQDADVPPGVCVVAGGVLRRATLVEAVARAAGRFAPPAEGPGETAFGPSTSAPGRPILVAEDDPVNQKVIVQQLTLLGYAAEVASHGREALAMWEQGDHALLLTDLHMPFADGHAVAREIRAAERRAGRPRAPIVALTAAAIRGEAERALAAGFDAYLTKPLQLADLRAALERFIVSGRRVGAAAADAGRPVLDVEVLAALLGDDREAIGDVLDEYRASALPQAATLAAACRAGRTADAAALAHRLKSSSRSVGALALGELCASIEHAAKAGRADALPALAARLDAQALAVGAALAHAGGRP